MHHLRRGFSRADLAAILVASVVFGAGVLIPGLNHQAKHNRIAVCIDHEMEIGKASVGWANDHRDDLPNFTWRTTTMSSRYGGGEMPKNDLAAVQREATELLRRVTGQTDITVTDEWLPQIRYTWLVLFADTYLTHREVVVCPEDRDLWEAQDVYLGQKTRKDPWLEKVLPHGSLDPSLRAYSSTYEFVPATWTPYGGTTVSGKRWPTVEQGSTEDEYRVPSRFPFGLSLTQYNDASFSSNKVWLYDSQERHFGSSTRSFADPGAKQYVLTFDLGVRAIGNRTAHAGGRPNDPCSPEPTMFLATSGMGALNGGSAGLPVKGYYRWTRSGVRGADVQEPETGPWTFASPLADDEFTIATPWPKRR